MKPPFLFSLLLCFSLLVTACSKDEDSPLQDDDEVTVVEPVVAPFQELYDHGIDRYLGVFAPTSTVSAGAGVTGEFSMFTSDWNSVIG